MKKKLILLSSGLALTGALSFSFVFLLKKLINSNKKRFICALTKLLALPLKDKNYKLVDDFLNLIIKLPSIKEVILVSKKNIFNKDRSSSFDISYLLTENIVYKDKIIGYLKIYFI